MVARKKLTETDKLINSIQAKINKLKKGRKSGRPELRSVDIICTSQDIARSKKK
ncbi:MAG: hypothetical protein MRERV_6c077 [Mycoplasmataceae bacterium RV_VA103A]|nr:MAG: hypothetical protein MRERV_6c077 [Mycoplasmataceae bacterium RV_VA103A]